MDDRKKLILIGLVIVVVLIVAFLIIYPWYRLSVLKRGDLGQLEVQKQQITDLQKKLETITTERNELLKKVENLTFNPEEASRYVRIIYPNGGETLCLGEIALMEWDSKGVEKVSLRLRREEAGSTNFYYIGLSNISSTFNEGNVPGRGSMGQKIESSQKIPLGDGYKMEIMSVDSGSSVNDISDQPFSIGECQG